MAIDWAAIRGEFPALEEWTFLNSATFGQMPKRTVEAMQKHFPKNEANRYSISGYFAAMLFTEGAKRAGRNLTRDGLVTALEGVKGWDSGILPPLTIGPDHETQRQGFWVKVENGRFKQLTDWLKSD